ncbi:hypothetical protein AOB60_29405 [Streptomyces noursei]|uniref:Uncharacterized protein n=1 Tax=Streptomyces noursei TaxID=1971 RepID=A0A2N8PB05_STRNR|nr:hypothetical protein AOB60_29405 [Streptomyces noursei]
MILQLKAEVGVERCLVLGGGGLEPVGHVAERLDHVIDLFLGEDLAPRVGGFRELLPGGGFLGLGFGNPSGDENRVGSGVEGGAIAGDALACVGDGAPCGFQAGRRQ